MDVLIYRTTRGGWSARNLKTNQELTDFSKCRKRRRDAVRMAKQFWIGCRTVDRLPKKKRVEHIIPGRIATSMAWAETTQSPITSPVESRFSKMLKKGLSVFQSIGRTGRVSK